MVDLYSEQAEASPDELAAALRHVLESRGVPGDHRADRRRRCGERPGPGHVGRRPVHLPSGPGRPDRGRAAARAAPDDGRAPVAVAAAEVRRSSGSLPARTSTCSTASLARTPTTSGCSRVAEVRDLTPVRDDDGRVVALPELEQMLVEALEGIRTFQSHRPPSHRLHWNRLLLYVWPAIDLSPEEMNAADRTAGAGDRRPRARDGPRQRASARARRPRASARAPDLRHRRRRADARDRRRSRRRPIEPLDEGARRIIAARRRGTCTRRRSSGC